MELQALLVAMGLSAATAAGAVTSCVFRDFVRLIFGLPEVVIDLAEKKRLWKRL